MAVLVLQQWLHIQSTKTTLYEQLILVFKDHRVFPPTLNMTPTREKHCGKKILTGSSRSVSVYQSSKRDVSSNARCAIWRKSLIRIRFHHEKIANENCGGFSVFYNYSNMSNYHTSTLPNLLTAVINPKIQINRGIFNRKWKRSEKKGCLILDEVLRWSALGNEQRNLHRNRFEGHRLSKDQLCIYAQKKLLKTISLLRRNYLSRCTDLEFTWSSRNEKSTPALHHCFKRVSSWFTN